MQNFVSIVSMSLKKFLWWEKLHEVTEFQEIPDEGRLRGLWMTESQPAFNKKDNVQLPHVYRKRTRTGSKSCEKGMQWETGLFILEVLDEDIGVAQKHVIRFL